MSVRMLIAVAVLTTSGCAFTHTPSQTTRTATEQLLLSQAIERSLHHLSVPLSEGTSVILDTVGFAVPPTSIVPSDLSYVRDAIAGRLGHLGLRVQPKTEEATYLIRVLVQSLGTVQGETFFGMPPIQSLIIPIALPELTLYKLQAQSGYMRYSLDIYESATGRLVRSTPWYAGSSYYNQYTVLFLLKYNSTDLILPP